MLNNNINLNSIFVDQIITGFERETLDAGEFSKGRDKYNSYGDARDTAGERVRINVQNSLHYSYLKDRSKFLPIYNDYVEFTGQSKSHNAEIFDKLAEDFDLEQLKQNPITLLDLGEGQYQVIDGFHRLALYLWTTKKKHIPLELVSGVHDNNINLGKRHLKRVLNRKLSRIHNQGFYNAWAIGNEFTAGYHGFELLGFKARGQRNNLERVEFIASKTSLEDRRILDLGCNSGGFILHIPVVEFALGIDFDKKSISFAKRLTRIIRKFNAELANRYQFMHKDLDKLSRAELTSLIIENSINLVCLLSMGSWLRNWKEIYSTVAASGVDILLETNNDSQGVDELKLLETFGYSTSLISKDSFDDNTGNLGRKTYICIKN